jgi:hypothetical protein
MNRMSRVERWAYVVLVLICMSLSMAVLQQEIRSDDMKFCEILQTSISVPVPKPADPSADPDAERDWKHYRNKVELSQRLGC